MYAGFVINSLLATWQLACNVIKLVYSIKIIKPNNAAFLFTVSFCIIFPVYLPIIILRKKCS